MAPMLSDEMRENIENLYTRSLKLMENPETLDAAIQNFKLILNIEPGNVKVKYALSKALVIKGDNVNALKYLKDINESDVNEAQVERILDILTHYPKSSSVSEKKDIGIEEHIGEAPESNPSLPTTGIVILIILIVSYFSLNFLTEGYLIGWDSMSHVFKTWFTIESFLGRSNFDWCEYWYQGSPIMPMYAPLFYIISALIAIVTRLNALEASKWLVFISYPLSSLSFYYYTRKKSCDLASFSGAILYGLIPWHFTYVTILGNPTYSMCFIFMPPLFKYLRGKNEADIIYSAISLSLLTLSHQGTGFLLVYFLVWFSILKGITASDVKKTMKKMLYILGISAGFLSFFWIPYLYYSIGSSSFKVPFELKNESIVQIIQKDHFMYLGLPLVVLLLLTTMIVLLSVDHEGIVYTVMTYLSLIITVGYTNPKIQLLYPFTKLLGGGYRLNIVSSFTFSMLIYSAIDEIPNIFDKIHNKFNMKTNIKGTQLMVPIIFLVAILSITTALNTSDFSNMPIPDDHHAMYSIIMNDPNQGRVWWLPRGVVQTSIPIFTSRSTPDGWYDQAAPQNVYNVIHDLADSKIYTDPEFFVSKLSVLSVRFLIVPNGEMSIALSVIDDLDLRHQAQDITLFYNNNVEQIVTNSSPMQSELVRRFSIFASIIFSLVVLYCLKYGKTNFAGIREKWFVKD
jgi:uncharacterized membrane protein